MPRTMACRLEIGVKISQGRGQIGTRWRKKARRRLNICWTYSLWKGGSGEKIIYINFHLRIFFGHIIKFFCWEYIFMFRASDCPLPSLVSPQRRSAKHVKLFCITLNSFSNRTENQSSIWKSGLMLADGDRVRLRFFGAELLYESLCL